jgi:DNA invertase Pin-like site-specific DNA recombinase
MTTAIYARVSTESDDQAHALEQQLSRLREHAAQLGEPVVEFVDVASGTRDDRPELKRLLECCEQGLLTTVLCTRMDRMSRSTVHGGKLLRLFNQESWPNLICLDQSIDLSTAMGRFYANLLMGMAQMESELIGERVHHGQLYARKQLKPQAGKPPFGYRYTEGKLNYELDPETAPIGRQIVTRFLQSASLRDAFDYQYQECGQAFRSLEGLRRWLLNPAIAGSRVYGTFRWKLDADGNKSRLLNKPGQVEEIHPHAHPGLISHEEQVEIQQVMQSLRVRSLAPIRTRRSRVLTGLVYCGHCGGLMHYHQPRKPGPTYLRCGHEVCPNRPHKVIQEKAVVEAVLRRLWEKREVLAYGSVVDELRLKQQLSPEIKQLQGQISDLRLLEDADLADVIERKEQRLSTLLEECVSNGGSRFTLADALNALDQPTVWTEMTKTPEQTRRLVSQWVERVVVSDGAVTEVRLRAGERAAHP